MSSLQIIVDTCPIAWRKRGNGELRHFEEVVEAVLSFGKAFLLLDRQNELRILASQAPDEVIAAALGSAPAASSAPAMPENGPSFDPLYQGVLYNSLEGSGPVELHATFTQRVTALIAHNDQLIGATTSATKGAATTERVLNEEEDSPSFSGLGTALSNSLCFVNRVRRDRVLSDGGATKAFPARVLVVQAVKDCATHYNAVMNCITAANALNVMVDVCTLIPSSPPSPTASSSAVPASLTASSQATPLGVDSPCKFMQQAADRTGGALLDASCSPSSSSSSSSLSSSTSTALLPQLLFAFLPSAAERAHLLRSPRPAHIDMSAANCFCHRRPLTEGTAFVCSVCLAIFCRPSAACPTCKTEIVSQRACVAVSAANAEETTPAGLQTSKRKWPSY